MLATRKHLKLCVHNVVLLQCVMAQIEGDKCIRIAHALPGIITAKLILEL